MDFSTNTTSSTTLTSRVTMELLDVNGVGAPMTTELSYNPQDPFAVSATFSTLGGQVRWTFGRDLLIGGLSEPTGDGDVHVWPCQDNNGQPVVVLELCSPDGEALVQAPTTDIAAFVDQMIAAVPQGAESALIDMDAAIAAIFAAEAA